MMMIGRGNGKSQKCFEAFVKYAMIKATGKESLLAASRTTVLKGVKQE